MVSAMYPTEGRRLLEVPFTPMDVSSIAAMSTVSQPLFRIDWGDPFPASYPSERLRLGAVVHLALVNRKAGYRLSPEAFEGSTPYCVVHYGVHGPNVTLSAGPQFQAGRRLYIWRKLERWVTLDQFDRAIAHSNKKLTVGHLHLTSEQEKSIVHLLNAVSRRLDLCQRLKALDQEGQLWADGVPLRVYLYLTCFDLLGRIGSHYDFGTWLSKHAQDSSGGNSANPCTVRGLWEAYNETHGSKRSFYRFIYEVLDEETRKELLEHVVWQERPYPPSLESTVVTDEKRKVKMLYSLRNDYTHQLMYLPDSVQAGNDEVLVYGDIVKGDRIIKPRFLHWPDILERCVLKGMANRMLMELGQSHQ